MAANDFLPRNIDNQINDNSERLNSLVRRGSEKPRYKNIVHLWEFLLELLAYGDECGSMIAWVREEHGEFKLKNPEEVAEVWGAFKNIKGMNYEKLSRALRHYYQKGIIKKVPRQRLVYKFDKLPYKYKPGITRSLFYGRRIKACIQQHLTRVQLAPFHINNSSFCPVSPLSTPIRRTWSWPLKPMPSRPVIWYPGRVPYSPPTSYSKTRIVFPFDNGPIIQLPSFCGFDPYKANLLPESGICGISNPSFLSSACCHI